MRAAADRDEAVHPSGSRLARLRSHALLAALSLLAILPLYWMLVTAFRAPNEIFSTVPWPQQPTLDNFRRVVAGVPILRMMANTVLVAALVTIAQLATALLAAYALARWRTPWTRTLLGTLSMTWLIPAQVVMVPAYLLVTGLGLLDTLPALVLPQVASAFAILMLFQTVRAFPVELIEAAIVDGAGHLRILVLVIVPNIRPALASLAILVFITSWNEYFWPLLVTRSPESAVIQIGLQMFLTDEGNQWGPLMAAASIATLPILALYAILQRQIVQSFVQSGLK